MCLIVRTLGLVGYKQSLNWMQQWVEKTSLQRQSNPPDEIWLLQHPSVYTQGQAGKAEHLLKTNDIPLILSDRGGQVTYHGPGQLVIYLLIDINRKQWGAQMLVRKTEQAILNSLSRFNITGKLRNKAPGVYVEQQKIASLGFRIRKGLSYHGLSLNINMNLRPFNDINPCGFTGLSMTNLNDHLSQPKSFLEIQNTLLGDLLKALLYTEYQHTCIIPKVSFRKSVGRSK